MRVAVVGVGGVGAYFGGKLALAGEDVTFIARGESLRAIQRDGLRVESPDGDFQIQPAQVTDDPASLEPVDVALLAVKGWQARDAIAAMRPLVGPETCVAPLLNGVEAPDLLSAEFGARRVIGGLCTLLGSIAGPGHIRNIMPAPSITFGELDNQPSERVQRLHDAFTRVGVRASVAPDIWAALWEKLMFVGPFGAIGTITRSPVGIFRAQAETRALLEQAMREVEAVARARGVAVAGDAVQRSLMMVDAAPEGGTSSMQRDIIAGRPSELEIQVGAVSRLGQAAGTAAPLHAFIYHALLPMERRARGELSFTL